MLRSASVLLLASLVAFSAPVRASEPAGANLPAWRVADADASAVTEANLLASERFWPYQASLSGGVKLPGSTRELPPGTLGVVIRIEPGARVRIDFGRDGLATLPVAATDVVARANAVRTGAAEKTAPNLTYAIAPRLLDARADAMRRVRLEDSFTRRAFLCVFANPDDASLRKLASWIAARTTSGDVLPVLFAQGQHPDGELHERLRAAGWNGAFAMNHLAEAYAGTLVDEELSAPRIALFSAEGRELWSGEFHRELPAELERALAEPLTARR
jgi:hypothetical protein